MSTPKVDTIHMFFMEDLLPVGIAIIDRVKKGGPSKVVQALTDSNDPIEKLREEGTSSAKLIREKLDKINPGLGNPIVDITTSSNTQSRDNVSLSSLEDPTLINILNRIDKRIDDIKNHIDHSRDFSS